MADFFLRAILRAISLRETLAFESPYLAAHENLSACPRYSPFYSFLHWRMRIFPIYTHAQRRNAIRMRMRKSDESRCENAARNRVTSLINRIDTIDSLSRGIQTHHAVAWKCARISAFSAFFSVNMCALRHRVAATRVMPAIARGFKVDSRISKQRQAAVALKSKAHLLIVPLDRKKVLVSFWYSNLAKIKETLEHCARMIRIPSRGRNISEMIFAANFHDCRRGGNRR